MDTHDIQPHSVDDTVTVGKSKALLIDLNNRSHLQELCYLAQEAANSSINPGWRRVYLRLADAASELDAYWARCEVKEDTST